MDTDVIVDRTEMATDVHELDGEQTFERIDLGTTSETGVWTGLANPTRVRV